MDPMLATGKTVELAIREGIVYSVGAGGGFR